MGTDGRTRRERDGEERRGEGATEEEIIGNCDCRDVSYSPLTLSLSLTRGGKRGEIEKAS